MSASVGQICAEGRLHRDFSHWRACIARLSCRRSGIVFFIVQMAVQILIKHYLIALPFRQSCSYDPRFRRPLKRTFRRTGILLLSKRKRYVRRTFRRTKTRKNLRSNRHLATEKPAKTQENSGICTPLNDMIFSALALGKQSQVIKAQPNNSNAMLPSMSEIARDARIIPLY